MPEEFLPALFRLLPSPHARSAAYPGCCTLSLLHFKVRSMLTLFFKFGCGLFLFALALGANPFPKPAPVTAETVETKALAFLIREVPAWSINNGCFSCHNNGDAARALYAAAHRGWRVPPEALTATTIWLSTPAHWDENKGDPGFSDKRLADVQFSAALLAAIETGHVRDLRPLQAAARKLAAAQDATGSWQVDAGNTLGSPATYGTPLATWMALRVLRQAKLAETNAALQRAEHWLRQLPPQNVFSAATALQFSAREAGAPASRKRAECLNLIRRAQTRDGGWGPYADAPPEAFDTALVLLALAEVRQAAGAKEMLRRGRNYLLAQQTAAGNWPATTRPAGGESYAQMVSTTGWALLALLATGE